MRRICLFALMVIWAFIQVGQVYGKGEVPERDYRIAVVLFNEAEYKAAEDKFSTVIEKGDLTIPKAAAYVVNSYYGRASCRIEQGRELKGDNKLAEALDKYDEAYSDLAVFKTKFQDLQDSLQSDTLYDEMEKHFVTVSDQMLQLAGEAGDICSKQGRHQKAIEWYDKGLLYVEPQSPTYGDILYAKADSIFQLGMYDETLRLLSSFEDELSDHKLVNNAMFYTGDIYRILAETSVRPEEKREYIEKAKDAYDRVIAGYLEGADVDLVKMALLEKGRGQKKLGNMDDAMAAFRTLQTNYPNTRFAVDAALEMGDYSFLAKRYSDAIDSFTSAAKVAKSLDLYDRIAISDYWTGWSYFSEASRIEAESPPELRRSSRNLYDKSIDAFQDSIRNSERFWKQEGKGTETAKELESYHGESLFMIGRCFQRTEKWDDAIKTFEKIPREYKEWWLKGLAEVALSVERKGDIDGSLAKWDELKREISIARVPNIELELLMRRAGSIFDLQRYPQAENAYRELVTNYPNSPDEPRARINLGLSLFKQDRNMEAIQEFTTMLSKYGTDSNQKEAIGEALFWKGYLTARVESEQDFAINLRQAIRDYKELVTRFPDDPRADDAQFEIGFCTYSLGGSDPSKYSEAIVEYSRLLQNYPVSEYSDDALFEIARCHRLLNNEAKEEESLRQLVTDYGTSEMADNALLRIAEVYFERAQTAESNRERQMAENTYNEIITKYPGTESEAVAHFQMGSIFYKFDGNFQTASVEFAKCAGVIEGMLSRIAAGEYISSDLDIAVIANMLMRSTFWQAESMFRWAKRSEGQAQLPDAVKSAYANARGIYQQVLTRGTRLRSDFPETTENLYNIMGGEKLDIPLIGEAQFMISRCLYEEGDLEGAKLKLQSVGAAEKLRLKSDYLMAYINYDQGKLVDAKTMAENWLGNQATEEMADEYNVGIQVLLAKIALDSGSVSEAKAQALDTWALFQTIDGLWEESAYIVGKCYKKENDLEKARSWFERLQKSPFELWRVAARDAISQL